MRTIPPFYYSGLCWMLLATSVAAGQRPNVIVLLADDLGSKDIGCYVNAGEKPVAEDGIDPQGANWYQWRGPQANGVSRTATPPIEWSEGKNVRWKVAIDGQGNSSPIIWGDKVFLLTAINTGRIDPSRPKPEDQPKRVFGITHPNTFYKFEVLCLDRNTGKELWRQTAAELVPHEGTHRDADFASASPTTDGERLYCWFGSAGMYCYDLDGKKLWERDLGKAYVGASLGEGCSPVVHQGKLVIVRDHSRQSSIEVLDARTGKTSWKKDRDEPNAWATPRIVEHSGKTQVITAGSNMIRSYDLDSGDIIWQCSGLTGNVTPCPIVDGDVVYCMSGYEGYSLLALPLNARGDISNSDKIVWTRDSGTPYVPSPMLYDGMLYFTQSSQAILTVVDSRTGETLLKRSRIPGVSNIYSSPVGADGRVYITGRGGTTIVLKRSGKLEVLVTNKLDDVFNASPALVGRQLFLRGRKSLYCLENQVADGTSEKNPHTLRINPEDPEGLIWHTDAGSNSCFSIHPKTHFVKEYKLLSAGQRIFVTTYDKGSLALGVICLSRDNGKVVWKKTIEIQKLEKGHPSFNPASSSPCCDGERVIGYFGSYGLVCFDLNGNRLWEKRLPSMV